MDQAERTSVGIVTRDWDRGNFGKKENREERNSLNLTLR